MSRFPARLRAVVGAMLVALLLAAPAGAQSTGDLFSGFGKKSRGPVQVDAETLEIYEEGEQRISVFSGNVTVRRGNTTMKASTIKLFSDKKSKDTTSGDSFTRIEASGTVYVNSGEQTVTGSRAVVETAANTITLVGNVVLSQGKNVITGERLIVDMATGRAKVEQAPGKRIQGVFTPDAARKKPGKDPPATQ